MIRRLKKDVQKELPPKLRSKVPMEISSAALKEIKLKMASLDSTTLDGPTHEDKGGISQLFKMTGEAKANSVADYVDYLVDEDQIFIIFAHHQVVMDVLESRLRKKHVGYIRIDGRTPQNQREGLVKTFQESKDGCRVALLSITACGHGLNLTAAGTAVFAELYWVPGQIVQAEDRCHRIGSTYSTINIHYCIANVRN